MVSEELGLSSSPESVADMQGSVGLRVMDIVVAFVYAAYYSMSAKLVENLIPSLSRVLITATAVCCYLLVSIGRGYVSFRSLAWGSLVGVPLGIGAIFQALGLKYTAPYKVAIWGCMPVLLLPIFQAMYRWWIDVRTIAAVVLVAFGIIFLEGWSRGGTTTIVSEYQGFGDCMAIIQAPVFTIVYMIQEFILHKTSPDLISFITGIMMGRLSGSGLWLLADFQASSWELDTGITEITMGELFLSLFITGVLGTAMTAFCENFALQRMPATEHTILLSAVPLWSMLISVTIFGQTISTVSCFGAVCMVVGLVVSQITYFSNRIHFFDRFKQLSDIKQ